MTTINALPYTIAAPGGYILAADLTSGTHGIVVECDDVIIDLQGHSINSTNSDKSNQYRGVGSSGCSNITVQNGTIHGFAYGVYLADPTYETDGGHLIQTLTVRDCTYRGIKVEGTGNIVRFNEISRIGGATFLEKYAMGIETYGHDGLIASNTIDNVRGTGDADLTEGVGICLSQQTDGTNVINNTITEPSPDIDGDYANWPGKSRSSYGIFVGGDAANVTVNRNTIENFYIGITFSRDAGGCYAGNNVTGAFISYYLLNNDGLRVKDGGGNLSDLNPNVATYGRFNPGPVETAEADYFSILARIPGADQFTPIRNPTAGNETISGSGSRDLVDYWLSHYFTSQAVTVDLQAGTATGWGGSDTLIGIEGVKGTRNNDVLYGSSGANLLDGAEGDDILEGRGGDDILVGGAGNNIFVFSATNNGNDRIIGFHGGTGIGDTLDLRGIFATFSQALAASHQDGPDLVIDLPGGGSITIENFYRGNFAADDVLVN